MRLGCFYAGSRLSRPSCRRLSAPYGIPSYIGRYNVHHCARLYEAEVEERYLRWTRKYLIPKIFRGRTQGLSSNRTAYFWRLYRLNLFQVLCGSTNPSFADVTLSYVSMRPWPRSWNIRTEILPANVRVVQEYGASEPDKS